MKKVLLINGSPHEAGCTFTALSEIEASLKKHGIESDLLYLGKKPLSGCTDCGFCAKAGKCVFEDAVNETIARLDQYDAIVAGTPVYYGGPSGQLCCFMDRLCFAGGSRLAGKLAASVVSCRRGGATSAFQRLNQYFAMNNMFSGGLPVLEPGARIYSGGCAPGSGGPADYADSGRKYGLDDEKYGGRQKRGGQPAGI